jgi:hypothetical protein
MLSGNRFMFCSGHYLRATLLGLALLLAGLANFVSMSYDADEQDSVPPVTVELKFVVRASARAHGSQIGSQAMPDHNLGSAHSRGPVAALFEGPRLNSDLSKLSSHHLSPLLC